MEFTTVCYLEKDDSYLMLHRVKKKNDLNEGKWIGVGGHFEQGESPEECILREFKEETGLTLKNLFFRGIVTFCFTGKDGSQACEYMCLFTSDSFEGELSDCNEGILSWVKKEDVLTLPIWEGDRIFHRLLLINEPFFSLKLTYFGDTLTEAVLNGRPMELFDIRDASGKPTGIIRERHVAHEDGSLHGTAHIWIIRPIPQVPLSEDFEILLQKRSLTKDAHPGCYDISSAGHLSAGDDFLPSALREMKEELGISADASQLKPVGFFEGYAVHEFYGRPFRNHELSAVYLYTDPVDPADLTLQKEEVESVCWQSMKTILRKAVEKDPQYCIHKEELDMLIRYINADMAK